MTTLINPTVLTTQHAELFERAGDSREHLTSVPGRVLTFPNLLGVTESLSPFVAPWAVEESAIENWVSAAMTHAIVEQIEDGFAASVPDAQGAWVDAATHDEALKLLPDVLFDWATLKLGDGDIPVFGDIDLNPR